MHQLQTDLVQIDTGKRANNEKTVSCKLQPQEKKASKLEADFLIQFHFHEFISEYISVQFNICKKV